MCCGGEDLPCATKPLTAPGTSWLPIHDMASYRTVPTEPIFRPSVKINDRNVVSAPTSIERKPNGNSAANDINSPLKERRGSDLSISSLPSSGSPQVFIRRGGFDRWVRNRQWHRSKFSTAWHNSWNGGPQEITRRLLFTQPVVTSGEKTNQREKEATIKKNRRDGRKPFTSMA